MESIDTCVVLDISTEWQCSFNNLGQGCIAAAWTAGLVFPAMPFLPKSDGQGGGMGSIARLQQEAGQNGCGEPGQLCW